MSQSTEERLRGACHLILHNNWKVGIERASFGEKLGPKRLYSSFENKSLGGPSKSHLFL